MTVNIKGYKVFIASPRGLEEERQRFFDTIQEYNRTEALPVNIQFIPVGWEYTPPGMGRPQSQINEEVKTCDYFVLALWDRWGTPPNKDGQGKYSSGTEEEYYIALDCIRDPKYKMRQLVTLFKAVDERRLNDPGPELQKVLDFKKKLEEEKTILFKTFEEPDDFEKMLRAILAQWRRDAEQGKTAKVHKPEPPSHPEPSSIPAETEQGLKALTEQTQKIVKEAQKLADEGKVTEAEELFAKAAVNSGEPYAYTNYGIFLVRLGRLGQARVMFEQALEISAKLGNEKGVAASYSNLGTIYGMKGELGKAEEMHRKSLEIAERIGLQEIMGSGYSNLGLVYKIRWELDKAEEMLKKALEIAEKLDLRDVMANVYGNLGLIYDKKEELEKAEEMHKKSLEMEKKLGRLEGMAKEYGNLGIVYGKRGELDKAEEMFKKSLKIEKDLGWLEGMANNYANLGNIYGTRSELDKAEEMHKKSLKIAEMIGLLEVMASEYGNLGAVYKQRGNLGKAREYWEKAQVLFKKIGMANEVKEVERWISSIDD